MVFEKIEKCSNIAVHIENVYRAWLRLWYYHIDFLILEKFLKFYKNMGEFFSMCETSVSIIC